MLINDRLNVKRY